VNDFGSTALSSDRFKEASMKSTTQAHAITGTKAPVMIAILGIAALLGGCNTTAGAGKDLSAGGKAVTNSAEKVKSKL